MKKILSLMLSGLLLTGCAGPVADVSRPSAETVPSQMQTYRAPVYNSRFDSVTEIFLSDKEVLHNSPQKSAVFTSHDIIYYEDRDIYESGNPYGEGTDADKHTAEEAAAHTVVNITSPGAYRITGKLSAGQIRIDLGADSREDPNAVVELILSNADITCTVAPAILFLNTYECDENWSADTAKPDVDTSAAGASLILEGENTISGSYVAKIYKDIDGEKKLWKQDGAIYSYMSTNVFGPGSLELNAENEGLDTELHLTVNGGNITINSDNDGINTNEDGVSVTTINGGILNIFAGLGTEGDGIDSNGYLVINGGTVVSSANPGADAGLDSDLGSYVNGGTVIAFGSTMDWAESKSGQVTMNLQFSSQQKAGSKITLTREDGTEFFSFDSEAEHARTFSGMILSHPGLTQGETYHVYVDGVQMAYSGNDVGRGPGGMRGGFGHGKMPKDFDPANLPEGETFPADFDPAKFGFKGQRPEGMTPPEGFDGEPPEGETFPGGELPEMPEGGFRETGNGSMQEGESSTEFYMNDMVNSFSGVNAAQ